MSLKRVTLELSNRCNRLCDGCPRHRMKYPLGDMSLSLLTKVTSQLNHDVTVVPFYRGESTLNPHFIEAMYALKDFNAVQIATNADNFNHHIRQVLLDVCSFVSVSLHEYLLPHETHLLLFFYECLGRGIKTQVSILDSLVRDKRQFSSQWLEHVDRVRIYKTHSVDGFGSMEGEPLPVESCPKPFEEMVVYWDGKVGLCNHDWNNLTPVGDLNCQTVNEVWDGDEYRRIRFIHSLELRQQIKTCEKCSFAPNQVYGEVIKNG